MRSLNCFVLLQKSAGGKQRDDFTIDSYEPLGDRLSIICRLNLQLEYTGKLLYLFQFVCFIISAKNNKIPESTALK